jgi:hypothetical protein
MVQTHRFAVQPGRAGSLQLVAQEQELALDWVLEDEGLVVVLELLAAARPSGEALPGGRPDLLGCLPALPADAPRQSAWHWRRFARLS